MSMAQAGDLDIHADGIDPARLSAMLDERDRVVARFGRANLSPPTVPVLRFRVTQREFALPLSALAGVTAPLKPHPIPSSSPVFLGMIVQHGLLFSVLRVDEALGLNRTSLERITAILLRGGSPRIALAADEALGATHVPAMEADGDTLVRLVSGAETGTVALIDPGMLLSNLGVRAVKPKDLVQ